MVRPPTMLSVHLLGPVEVRRDGGTLDLGGPQQRALIAHLALDVGRVVPVERLIERLWGDDPPRTALGTLQSYVSRLRRLLEPGRVTGTAAQLLVSEAPGYALRIAPEAVDVHEFDTAHAAARRSAAARNPPQPRQQNDAALGLWRGPALAGVGPDDQIRPIVVRLEEARLQATEERFEALLALGRHTEAVPALQAAVDQSPLRERLWAQLALALYRASRQADALRAVAAARATLLDELGLDPGPELRELEARILAHDPALLAVPEAATPPAPAERAEPPRTVELVGRAAEWEQLQRALALAARGHTQVVLVEGEPGIGKSTLCDAFLAHARGAGWRVAIGRCVESGLAPSLWPAIEIVRAVIAEREPVPVPVTANALYQFATADDATPLTLSPIELADQFAALLDDLAATPLVMLLDDLHWADRATLDVTLLAAERLGARKVLVVAAHRPPETVPGTNLTAALGRLARLGSVHRVAMSPLSTPDVARLIELTAGAAPSPEIAERVQRRAGGNPLFVAELARLAGERGITDPDQVPAAIRDVVRDRLAQMPPDTRRELEVAATVGGRFDVRTVIAASERAPDDCLDALDAAIVTRILVPDGDGFAYRFTHALVRDAVLAEVTPLRRARLHHRVANALLDTWGDGPDQAEPIAHHRLAGLAVGDPVETARAAIRAADVGRWRGAYDESEALAERALEVLAAAPRSPAVELAEVQALESIAGLAVRRLGDDEGRHRAGERVLEFAERVDHDGARALGLFLMWDQVDEREDLRELDQSAIRALAERTSDKYALGLTEYMIGAYDWLTGDLVGGRTSLERMIARVGTGPDDRPDHVPIVLAPVAGALASAVVGDVQAARDHAHRRVRAWLSDRAEVDPTASAAVTLTIVILEALLDEPTAVLAELDRAELTDDNGLVVHQMASCELLGMWARARLGQAVDVSALDARMAAIADSPERVLRSMLRTFYGATLLELGEARAVAVLAQARGDAETRHETWWLAETIRLQALADERFGDGTAAPGWRREAAQLAAAQGAALVVQRLADTPAGEHAEQA